eukprot:gene8097-16615_t
MVPDSRKHSGSSGRVSFAVTQIPGKSDEDRHSQVLNYKAPHFKTAHSFGVFDGHEGKFASSLCAELLHSKIFEYYAELDENALINGSTVKGISAFEELFSESIRTQCGKIDLDIKATADAGTTAASLYLMEYEDGKHRALCSWVGDSRCVLFMKSGDVESNKYDAYLMTEDHKPSLPRERLRIEKQAKQHWNGRPLEVSLRTFRDDPLDYSVHSRSLLSTQIPKLKKDDSRTTESIHAINNCDNASILIVHEKSFIGRRAIVGYEDNLGPLAVCGRYGLSLNMTRSIGDRYGPRSCISTPDITSITIESDRHARFIIASDGIWDVLSVEEVQAYAMQIKNPQKLSYKIALSAWLTRMNRNIRLDDITVQVIDVNYELFSPPNTNCSCIMA